MSILRKHTIMILGLCSMLFGWGEHIQSIHAEFEQHILNEEGIPALYRGQVFGKVPSKAKWLYETPLKKEVYMNDETLIVYEPELRQVSYSQLESKVDFLWILKSAKKQKDGTYRTTVDGVPYVLFVDQADTIDRVEFSDSMGTKTIIKLKNVRINTITDDALFQFMPPEGVEIVNLK